MNQALKHVRLQRGIATAVTVLVAAATLTGCGGGGDAEAATPTEYSEAVASAWKRVEGTKVSEAQARCWGGKLVDRLGIDRVRAYGDPVTFGAGTVDLDLVSMNFSQAEAQSVHDDFTGCGANLIRDKNLLLNELGLPEDLQQCVSDSLDGEVMEDFFVSALQSGKDIAAAQVTEGGLRPALEQCVEVLSAELSEVLG